MCEGTSKQTLDLRILPRRDAPTPNFEIPGSASDQGHKINNFGITLLGHHYLIYKHVLRLSDQCLEVEKEDVS